MHLGELRASVVPVAAGHVVANLLDAGLAVPCPPSRVDELEHAILGEDVVEAAEMIDRVGVASERFPDRKLVLESADPRKRSLEGLVVDALCVAHSKEP